MCRTVVSCQSHTSRLRISFKYINTYTIIKKKKERKREREGEREKERKTEERRKKESKESEEGNEMDAH